MARPDAGGTMDAGTAADAGGTMDAGTAVDAGGTMDAGTTVDAGGTMDAGTTVDAGGGSDAGTTVDAGGGSDAGTDAGTLTCPGSCPWACRAGVCDDAVQVVTGGNQLACVRLASGRVACWGLNDHGQLGDGDLVASPTPVYVLGLDDAVWLDVGYAHACAVRATGGSCAGARTVWAIWATDPSPTARCPWP